MSRSRSEILLLALAFILPSCFSVYPIREEIIETRVLNSSGSNRTRNILEIRHEFKEKNLELQIIEFSEQESLLSEKVLQKRKIFFGYRKSDGYRQLEKDDKPWNRDILGMFADLAALFELISIPFRTMSETKEEELARESILTSEKKEIPIREELTLILRAKNGEILNGKLGTPKLSVSLSDMKRILPELKEIEVLVYRKNERAAYKVIPMDWRANGI